MSPTHFCVIPQYRRKTLMYYGHLCQEEYVCGFIDRNIEYVRFVEIHRCVFNYYWAFNLPQSIKAGGSQFITIALRFQNKKFVRHYYCIYRNTDVCSTPIHPFTYHWLHQNNTFVEASTYNRPSSSSALQDLKSFKMSFS